MTVVEYDYCRECFKKGVSRRYFYGWRYRCRYCGWELVIDSGGKA